MDQELQRNPMKSSYSRTNSKYKSPYGCRTNSHCVNYSSYTAQIRCWIAAWILIGYFSSCIFSKNQNLRLRLQSFLNGKDESGQILSNVEKTQCAIVLLHSLPCARHAVLEQLCDVFHEAVQKYVLEFERQTLSGEFYFYSYKGTFQKIYLLIIVISVFVGYCKLCLLLFFFFFFFFFHFLAFFRIDPFTS